MAQKRRSPLRRLPRQSRSRVTRDAIIEAAARTFEEHGLEKGTIAEIAKVAGVSQVSLCQYFPDKESPTVALFGRESESMRRIFLELVGELGLDDVPMLARRFFAATVERFETQRKLYRVLLEEVPRAYGLEPTHEIDRRAIREIRLLLEVGRRRVAAADLDVAAKLIVRAYRYTTLAILREPLEPREREHFVDELCAMICDYLFGPRPPHRERVPRGR